MGELQLAPVDRLIRKAGGNPRLINLTPHPVVWVGEEDSQRVELPPSGKIARVGTKESPAGELLLEGDFVAPLITREWGAVELPTPESLGVENPEGVFLVVSSLVGEAIKAQGLPPEWRGAIVVAPDTGPQSAVRDADGRIIGVKRFVLFTPVGGVRGGVSRDG